MAFTHYSPISINAAQVPTTQTDFPVLVSQIDARFKTTGNGGHVQNSSGFDIRPYTDSGLGTAITGYELERYNATTGEVVMWVKVSSLTSSSTPIYLAYGNGSLTTDGSSTSTWSNSFSGVYHLADGTTLNVNSSTGSNNGTNHGATATSGKIDGGAAFVAASSQYIGTGTLQASGALSYSAWVNATSFPNTNNAVVGYTAAASRICIMYVDSAGKLACYAGAGTPHNSLSTAALSTGTTYYLCMTYSNSTGIKGYINGGADGTGAADGSLSSGEEIDIGREPLGASNFWDGMIDEVRVSSAVRSADWITTEYNNQFAPGTFETLGTEVGTTFSGIYMI